MLQKIATALAVELPVVVDVAPGRSVRAMRKHLVSLAEGLSDRRLRLAIRLLEELQD